MSSHIIRKIIRLAAAGLVVAALPAAPLAAQQTGSISGRVVSAAGQPLEGVSVVVEGTQRGALSDARGVFQIAGVPAGQQTLRASKLGLQATSRAVQVAAGGAAEVRFVLTEQDLALEGMVVSLSREAQRRVETPASIGVLGAAEIRAAGAAHPGEVMRQVPGVWVNVTGGEGHQTAIRQPLTTNPVYLFLEDGVPTRSTGFFNHNALYEVNVPQAERIEVTKGPATALYGSDAIGGIINVATATPSRTPTASATLEGGAFGWGRLLLAGSNTFGGNGLLAELNLTRTDGWRDATDYTRQSGTLRWDRTLGSRSSLRTVATYSHIDQATAGASAISRDDYLNHPRLNYTPISYRKVQALRLSSEYALRTESSLFTLTPFVRWNEMELLANWSLAYDPTVYTTGHRSLGVLAKARKDFAPLSTRLIGGVDVDYSPGYRDETLLKPVREGKIYTQYSEVRKVYDYDVTFRGVSPYLQAEAQPLERMHVVAGLRYDMAHFDYQTHLAPEQAGAYRRPASTAVSYRHLSPKLGATYEVAPALNLFASYGHGFRAPSEGQLFRQGQAVNTVDLAAVKVDSYEGGARGVLFSRLSYDLSVYRMTKTDDILSYTNADGTRETVNAGRTLHRGVELGLGAELGKQLRADVSYSRAKHTYEAWSPKPGVEMGGNEIEMAPRTLANASLTYRPSLLAGSRFGVEWTRVGSYWMDPENTHRYEGHSLLSARASVPVRKGVRVFGRVTNLTDRRFAESAAYTVARGEEFAPGMPRTVYVGVEVK